MPPFDVFRRHFMAKHWMARAFGKNPGAEHRALGVPEGQPIPPKKHAQAARGMFGKKAKKMEQLSKNANG